MNPHHHTTRLNSHEHEQSAAQQQSAQTTAVEFATPEEMLRHDAAHTPLPAGVAERLRQSLKIEGPPPRAPWWRRIFGG